MAGLMAALRRGRLRPNAAGKNAAPQSANLAASAQPDRYMSWDDVGAASAAWRIADGAVGSPYDAFRDKHLPLPDWFDSALDPLSPKYLAQQDRIWRMMIGDDAEYDAEHDEQSGVDLSDPLVRPGLYREGPELAGDHLIALGHIIKTCGLGRGDRVLEYGAGYGQIALTLARLGMKVDTVDIDPGFCTSVQMQADWFKVDLTAHHGKFGDNPAGHKYSMILFYEAFHHSREFVALIERSRHILEPGGRIVMAGEPIHSRTDEGFLRSCPYPWGIRLEAEVAAIVRFRRWYELGFQEEFLFDTFSSMGFTPRKYPGQISNYATVYSFALRSSLTKLADWGHSAAIEATWHGREPEGRWTTAMSLFPVDTMPGWTALRIACVNHHPQAQVVTFELGSHKMRQTLQPEERRDVIVPRDHGARMLNISCEPITPSSSGIADDRKLGIFVREIEYLE